MTVGASAIDAGIQKKIHGSRMATLVISNKKMNNIVKIVKAFDDSSILLRCFNKTIENETKEQKGGFLGMLLGTSGASLLENMLAGKVIMRAGYGDKEVKQRDGIARAGYISKMDF